MSFYANSEHEYSNCYVYFILKYFDSEICFDYENMYYVIIETLIM